MLTFRLVELHLPKRRCNKRIVITLIDRNCNGGKDIFPQIIYSTVINLLEYFMFCFFSSYSRTDNEIQFSHLMLNKRRQGKMLQQTFIHQSLINFHFHPHLKHSSDSLFFLYSLLLRNYLSYFLFIIHRFVLFNCIV